MAPVAEQHHDVPGVGVVRDGQRPGPLGGAQMRDGRARADARARGCAGKATVMPLARPLPRAAASRAWKPMRVGVAARCGMQLALVTRTPGRAGWRPAWKRAWRRLRGPPLPAGAARRRRRRRRRRARRARRSPGQASTAARQRSAAMKNMDRVGGAVRQDNPFARATRASVLRAVDLSRYACSNRAAGRKLRQPQRKPRRRRVPARAGWTGRSGGGSGRL